MTISEAFKKLIESSEYKEICKEKKGKGAKYRVYKGRFIKGELHELAMVALLMDHGYKITVKK
jgi:hypothetical protein